MRPNAQIEFHLTKEVVLHAYKGFLRLRSRSILSPIGSSNCFGETTGVGMAMIQFKFWNSVYTTEHLTYLEF